MDGELKRKLMVNVLLNAEGKRLEFKSCNLYRRQFLFRWTLALFAVLLFILGGVLAFS